MRTAIFLILTIVTLAFGLLKCGTGRKAGACIDENKIEPDAVCMQVYAPVCGCDGKTYSNACMAEKAGLTSWNNGACE